MPPWKPTKTVSTNSSFSQKLKKYEAVHSISICQLAQTKPIPTPPFTSLEEEVQFLNSKLQSNTNFEAPLLSTVILPSFQYDQDDHTTKNLIQEYRKQRKIMEDIVMSKFVLQTVFETLTEAK